jgi:hypothetical protein
MSSNIRHAVSMRTDMQLRTPQSTTDETPIESTGLGRAGLLVIAVLCLPVSAAIAATATAAVPDTAPSITAPPIATAPSTSTSTLPSDESADTVVHAAVRRQEPFAQADDGRKITGSGAAAADMQSKSGA